MMEETKCPLPFKTPTTISVIGGSSSGKTFFVSKLLKKIKMMFDPVPKLIIFCYAVYQPEVYGDLERSVPNIRFQDTLPTEEELKSFALESDKSCLLVLDDYMQEVCKNPLYLNLYTTLSHHLGISVINIQQSAYPKGECNRTISLNTHHFVLMSNPRSAHEYKILASQIFPGQAKYFAEAFRDAVAERKYGYLVVDTSPHADERYGRLRTNILPGDDNNNNACTVYLPK